MTRLFIRFYLGVLVVLFLAWYIHGLVSQSKSRADQARVATAAHAGGARVVAEAIDAGKTPRERSEILENVAERFDYSLAICKLESIGESARRALNGGEDVVFEQSTVLAKLECGDLVRLGKFPNYTVEQIEAALAGWMRLTRDQLRSTPPSQRDTVLEELRRKFEFPLGFVNSDAVPQDARRIYDDDHEVAFFSPDGKTWYSAIRVDDGQAIRFGPFPSFENIGQKAATTTLGLVLLPAALAIALLLRPVANQLRQVENAAQTIAAGDLSARVDAHRMNSAKPLANAFNHMAGRTESLVRTQRELLQAVSHELRTPLARMRFAIDLIGSSKDDGERQERLNSLDAATEELNELVGELLSYVRLETAEPELDREELSVDELVGTLFPQYSALHPDVSFHSQETVTTVVADRHAFRRALGNLISNAGKHASSRVQVSVCVEDGMTVVEVDDDGDGIPESDRERVLEPFVRLDSANSKVGGRSGVGLGLALVQRIVLRHGGTVEVLSSPLGGCKIRTAWPAKPT